MTPEGNAAITQFLSGAMMMGYAAAGLFFLRFYQQTRDRLFLLFGLAFWILGLNRVAMIVVSVGDEMQPVFYVVRLLAFIVILVAIVDKNRSTQRAAPPPTHPVADAEQPDMPA